MPEWKRCGNCNAAYSRDKERCPLCYTPYESPETYESMQIHRIATARLLKHGENHYIAKEILELYDGYDDASIADVVAFQGPGGGVIYFEIIGEVHGWGPDPVPAWMLHRVEAEWPEDWPVLDVNPEEAVTLGQEEEERAEDEAA